MNILFLSLMKFSSFEEHNIYTDLLRELIKHGHTIQAVCPSERRYKESTNIKTFNGNSILTVKTFNIQKTNIVEKGIGTLAIKNQFIKAIKKFFNDQKFDLILYPTPPITLCGVVEYFKKRDSTKTYLMLKDIFPQNAVDLGIMKKTGFKSLLFKYFRKKEKRLYLISDKIGCMSQANLEYILLHNNELDKNKVEIFPNCIDPRVVTMSDNEKNDIKKKYCIPCDKKIFVYGGNLGKPQGIPFVIECLSAERNNNDVFFLIVGDGTEFKELERYYQESKQSNFMLLNRLPTDEFDRLIASCDVGLIFLDNRFTIPNFPSRLLSYLQAGIPVLACTDSNSDIGKTIVDGEFGWWCQSNDPSAFVKVVEEASTTDLSEKKKKAEEYLMTEYNVKTRVFQIIL